MKGIHSVTAATNMTKKLFTKKKLVFIYSLLMMEKLPIFQLIKNTNFKGFSPNFVSNIKRI